MSGKKSLEHSSLKYLQKQMSSAVKAYALAVKNPGKEEVYKLRVNLRRIRTMLYIASLNRPELASTDEAHKISKLFKLLGKQRDVEVAIEHARQLGLDISPLKELRKELQATTASKIAAGKYAHALKHLEQRVESLHEDDLKADGLIFELINQIQPDFQLEHEVHQFRIILKKVRYLAESLNLPVKKLKHLQDVFGRLNDLSNLQSHFPLNPHVRRAQQDQLAQARKLVPQGKQVALKQLDEILQLKRNLP